MVTPNQYCINLTNHPSIHHNVLQMDLALTIEYLSSLKEVQSYFWQIIISGFIVIQKWMIVKSQKEKRNCPTKERKFGPFPPR